MNKHPLVSVIIPAYNSAHFLPDTLKSVIEQTYDNYEVVVVDDGSTDNTRDIMDAFIHRPDGKIRYLVQKNQGPSAARNYGIKEARGEYIAFLDADDSWEPAKLSTQLQIIGEHTGLEVVFTDVVFVKNGISIENSETTGIASTMDPSMIFDLIAMEVLFPSAALIKKSILEKIGGFDTSFRCGEDMDVWLRILPEHTIYFHHQSLVKHNVIENSLSSRAGAQTGNSFLIKAFMQFLSSRAVPRALMAKARKKIGQYYFEWGWDNMVRSNGKTTLYFLKSLYYDPFNIRALRCVIISLLPVKVFHLMRGVR